MVSSNSITNSSIQLWLDFNGTLPTTIPPCQLRDSEDGNSPNVSIQSCTDICTHISALIDPLLPNNLLTCGLWASLVGSEKSRTPDMDNKDLVPFISLGLDYKDVTYANRVQDTVWMTLHLMFTGLAAGTSTSTMTTGAVHINCSSLILFAKNSSVSSGEARYLTTVSSCLSNICVPKELNPDLAGIGIYVSLLLQSFFAITVPVVLIILRLWSNQQNRINRDRTLNLITALVDFHKCQCYFIIAIGVATLVLVARGSMAFKGGNNNFARRAPIYDTMFTMPLAMSGFVPVISTLVGIAHYDRLSAPPILLSVLAVVLSTISLVITGRILPLLTNLWDPIRDPQLSRVVEFAKVLCGSESSMINIIQYQQFHIHLVWAIYSYCALWCLWCIVKFSREELMKSHDRLQPRLNWSSSITFRPKLWKMVSSLTWTICITLWGLSFGYIFYLYSMFWKNRFVPSSWDLGQIISIFVWAPTILDFLYTQYKGIEEGSSYRYPPGLSVVKTIVRPSAGLANLELQPQKSAQDLREERQGDTASTSGYSQADAETNDPEESHSSVSERQMV